MQGTNAGVVAFHLPAAHRANFGRQHRHRMRRGFDHHRHRRIHHRRRLARQRGGECARLHHQRLHEGQIKPLDFGAVAHCVHVRRAGFKQSIGLDTAPHRHTRRLRQLSTRPQTDRRQHDVGRNRLAVVQHHLIAGRRALDAFAGAAEMPAHPQRGEAVGQALAGFNREQTLQRPVAQMHHVDREPGLRQIVGELAADQSAAEHGDALLAVDGAAEGGVFGQVIHRQHRIRAVADEAVRNRVGAEGENQFAVFEFTVLGVESLRCGINRGDPGVRQDRCIQIGRQFFRAGTRQRRRRFSRGERVRQIGLGIKRAVVRGHERDRRGGIALADFLQQRVAGKSGPDDDNLSVWARRLLPLPLAGEGWGEGGHERFLNHDSAHCAPSLGLKKFRRR